MPLILFNQSQQVRRQVIIFHILFVTNFTSINNPFEIDPLAIDKVILVFIVWIPASERKKEYDIGRPFMGNERMQKWDTNEDFDKKCIVLFISFHEKIPIQKQKP